MIRSTFARLRRETRIATGPGGSEASKRREGRGRLAPALLVAFLLAIAGVFSPNAAAPAAAASTKIVIIVGPVGDAQTATYISDANAYAAVARKYSSNVVTIYSPHATWAAVKSAAQGANILVYLGHGNGFPSPYSSTLNTGSMDGFGLNRTDNAGNSNWAYYGESYVVTYLKLAPNAVVLFSRLCYASGNSEWGAGKPSLSVAKQRVDNYAAGFIKAGARAVIADGLGDAGWYISALFTKHSSIDSLFRSAPNRKNNYTSFASVRSPGYTALMDVGTYSYVPDGDPYYRSMVSIPSLSTDAAMGLTAAPPPFTGKTLVAAYMRSGAATSYKVTATLAAGTAFTVRAPILLSTDGATWAPIRLANGKIGWLPTRYASFGGSARATVALNLRASASTSGTVVAVLSAGSRFTVTRSTGDAKYRAWLVIRTSTGRTGYVASWFTGP